MITPAHPRSDRHIGRANAEFQLLAAVVNNRAKRRRQGRFVVQGVGPIDAAIDANWPVTTVLLSDSAHSDWALALSTRASDAEVVRLTPDLIGELSGRDEGAEALLVAKMVERDVASVGISEGPIVIVEAPQGPGNLGTIFRGASGLGGSGVIVTGHGADPYDPRCIRASRGAIFSVPFARARSVAEAAEALGRRRVVALHPEGTCIDDVDLGEPIALLAGRESTGLSRNALATSSVAAAIPTRGPVDSLNVAMAVSIALAEVDRRRRLKGQE